MIKITCIVFRILVGITLLWSATEHLKNPQFFLISIIRYELFWDELAKLVAFAVPIIELVLAVCLIANYSPKVTVPLSSILFIGFAAVQATAYFRGMEIDCGCFGTSTEHPISMTTIGINLLVAALLVASVFIKPKFNDPSKPKSNYEAKFT